MSKQILLSLLNCSWQWLLLGGLIWFIATRFRRSNTTTVDLLWLLSLLSLPILFSLNQFVPAPAIGGAVPELTQAEPVNVSGLAALTTDLPKFSSAESDAQSQNEEAQGALVYHQCLPSRFAMVSGMTRWHARLFWQQVIPTKLAQQIFIALSMGRENRRYWLMQSQMYLVCLMFMAMNR